MEIVGYIGLLVLVFLAVTWTIGVRVKLDARTHTIIGAIFFLVAALVLLFSDVNKFHSLWLIPAGFVLPIVLAMVGGAIPVLLLPFRLVAGLFASIVRIGIPAERIRAAQEAGLRATVEEWAQNKRGDS